MSDLFAALDATWPAASAEHVGPWLVRNGRGGGKRVSCAIAINDEAENQIELAETAQAKFGQAALFCLRGTEEKLDTRLADKGYRVIDPVVLYSAPTAQLAAQAPEHLSSFPIWPPLAIMKEIWLAGGIGPERLAVMQRAQNPKTSILGRAGDRAAGAAFVAIHDATAIIHALHVQPDTRRQGLANNLMRAAANWAMGQGATHVALAVTEGNVAANALYQKLGMTRAGSYHYRIK